VRPAGRTQKKPHVAMGLNAFQRRRSRYNCALKKSALRWIRIVPDANGSISQQMFPARFNHLIDAGRRTLSIFLLSSETHNLLLSQAIKFRNRYHMDGLCTASRRWL
jgi:hypothetical protein